MSSNITNYAFICYPLKNDLYPQLDNPLKEEIDKLSNEITTLLISGKKVRNQSTAILRQIFNLRIKAIKWLTSDIHFDYFKEQKNVFYEIEQIGKSVKFECLKDNLLFALRCNQRVSEHLFSSNGHVSANSLLSFSQLPEISYEDFIASLAYVIPDDGTLQQWIDFTNASLYIEFVMFASGIIKNDSLKVTDKVINDLSFLVADSAQEYSALAVELGILNFRSSKLSFMNLHVDESFVNEQKELADIGLNDFAKNFTN